ncbi:MAG TPA: hypothetical protein VMO00_12355 [Methylomirabilota bacterium]|nr:hypothetical protein [Methylomirabilota bacterium]
MNQIQLDEIWQKHLDKKDLGSIDIAATADEDGNDRIQKDRTVWERKKGSKIWTEVPPLQGNL